VAVVGSKNGDIGAHPLAARFAKRIDALHGETGQVLHLGSLRVRKAQVRFFAAIKFRAKNLPSPLAARHDAMLPLKKTR
jgi:hypothetical protein